LIEASNIGHLLADVISVDAIETYKPSTAAYALVEPSLGIPRQEILFVSSNSFDVAGAKRFGFSVAWIDRGGSQGMPTNSNVSPSEFFKLLRGRTESLKYEADVRLQALTELSQFVRASLESPLRKVRVAE
jgi:2-haloacid dehalogenase